MSDTSTVDALAAALVNAREAACLTQEDLAEKSGLSVRAIRNLETGHTARPRKQSLLLLAKALGLSPTEVARLLRTPRTENRPERPSWLLPAELPAAPVGRLVGRERTVTSLRAHLATRPARGHGRPAVVVGPPGAGKTSLVLEVAHGVRDLFPDGQVFVDLHPAATDPFTPDKLVRRILRSLGGVPAAENPEEARAQLRDTLSRRHVLVVLDNVDSEAQVRPLLVDDARSAVLVAARRELTALSGQVRHLIGALGARDAHQLLEDLVGTVRTRAELSAATSIVRSCGRLPLALHIAGLWLSARPHRTLHDLADRLVDERNRMPFLRVGDLSLQASVAACHQVLPAPVAASLRRLGAVRGDFGVDDVTGRAAPSRQLAVDLLDELLNRQVTYVSEVCGNGQVRYRLHDSVRLYVAHCCAGPADDGRPAGHVWLPRQTGRTQHRIQRLRHVT
ncbi:helix-turn-helix domain-containing protein [Streptomyces sp. MMS24-I2-30]|uniref:helix-turn-helix domain-containing protein n=1 Tax=Streptomyces sp. MMS24-I2-30 TaxID=3351564 RepID=UPI003896AA12